MSSAVPYETSGITWFVGATASSNCFITFEKDPDSGALHMVIADEAHRGTDGAVIDVFTSAGLSKPDISILSDQFLFEVRGLKHKSVAAELLEKLLKNELKVRSKRNLVQAQVFSEKLKKALNDYHNRAISTMQVIEEVIKLAKDLDAAAKAGQEMGQTEDEKAFYDARAANASALVAMGDEKLKLISAELITQVRKS